MSEVILKVGRKGEIFTNKELRRRAGIRKGGRVRAKVVDRKLVVEPLPSIEDLLVKPVSTISVEEVERLSEEAQRERGLYG